MKNELKLASIFLIVAVLAGCNGGLLPSSRSRTGSLSLTVSGSSESRTIEPILDTQISTYEIELVGAGEPVTRSLAASDTTTTIGALAQGTWLVTVYAKNAADTIIGTGSTSVEIVEGQTATASVPVSPVVGHGTLSLAVSWPTGAIAAPSIQATLVDQSGTEWSLSFGLDTSADPNVATYLGTMEAGYYLLTLNLLDGTSVVWGTAQGVRVVARETSEGTFALATNELNALSAGEAAIEITANLNNPVEITLSGVQSSLSVGNGMTVTASTAEQVETYRWYVDGQLLVGETTDTATIGSTLSVGGHRVDVVVEKTGTVSSTGYGFAVADPSDRVRWSYDTGSVIDSSASIGPDGTVYVGSADGVVHAVNYDGTVKWTYNAGGAASTPVVADAGTLYVGTADGTLHALASDGTLEWQLSWPNTTIETCPAIGASGVVYVWANCTDTAGAYLTAVNSNGTERWRHMGSGPVAVSPVVAADGTIYGADGGDLVAFDPNGTIKWTVSTGMFIQSAPAIGADGSVYFGNDHGYLYALNSDGTEQWRRTFAGNVDGDVVLGPDGTICGGENASGLYIINSDGTNGSGFATAANIYGAPAVGGDGRFYLGLANGEVLAAEADGTTHWSYVTGGAVTGSPTIGLDGTVYVGSADGYLYAFRDDSGGPWAGPWPMYQQNLFHHGRQP
jgi:outer membrane protein assembly factor BamB